MVGDDLVLVNHFLEQVEGIFQPALSAQSTHQRGICDQIGFRQLRRPHLLEDPEGGVKVAAHAMVLHEDVADAGVGLDGETGPGVGKKVLGEVEPAGFDEGVEAGGEGLERGVAVDEEGDGGAEEVDGLVGKGGAAEEWHQAEEDGLVKEARLEGHAAKDGVEGREAAVACELEEEGGVGGVVVGEAGLRSGRVEEVEGPLRVCLPVDESHRVGVGDKPGSTPLRLSRRRRRKWRWCWSYERSWFKVLKRRYPFRGRRGGGDVVGDFDEVLGTHCSTLQSSKRAEVPS